jgi:predicted nucleotidyltransferase
MDRSEIIERLRAQRGELNARGVEHLAIFGSRARGDFSEGSDLDLLIDVPRGTRFSLVDLVAVERRIGEKLGVSVAAVLRRSLKPAFAQRIADDLVDVF